MSDEASNRLLIFDKPLTAFMEAGRVIGQRDLVSFEPIPFDQGGLAFPFQPEVDSRGRVWLIHNLFFVSMYQNVLATGQNRDYWFDFFAAAPSGPRLQEPLSFRYRRLATPSDGSLLLFGGEYAARIDVPIPEPGGLVNAATFREGLSPGGIYTLFGVNLGFAGGLSGKVVGGELETTVGKTQVLVNNKSAPIFFAGFNQINFQAPFELHAGELAAVSVATDGFRGPEISIAVEESDPGIFVLSEGVPTVVDDIGTIGRLRAERIGIVFATGLGGVSGPIGTGMTTPVNQLHRTRQAVQIEVGSHVAPAVFDGLAPGFVGLYQVNFEVPAILGTTQMRLCQGGQCGPAVSVSVE